ncbi:hypothetical protein BIFDEN_01953 [Bifidobacterium dentium ATCC 27678]|nr:hypothetical protein BIFDEN_01953 [Bifidobacterium dentium ATCC 27678]
MHRCVSCYDGTVAHPSAVPSKFTPPDSSPVAGASVISYA